MKKSANKKPATAEPTDYKVNPALQDKYRDQPLFVDKVNRANHILKTVGLPDFKLLAK